MAGVSQVQLTASRRSFGTLQMEVIYHDERMYFCSMILPVHSGGESIAYIQMDWMTIFWPSDALKIYIGITSVLEYLSPNYFFLQ